MNRTKALATLAVFLLIEGLLLAEPFAIAISSSSLKKRADVSVITGADWDNVIDHLRDHRDSSSYIIYLDGSTVKVFNTTTGNTDYSGGNATTIIQSAIDDLTSGGIISIASGNYSLTGKLYVTSNLIIRGFGMNSTILYYPSGSSAQINRKSSEVLKNVVFQDFSIIGRKDGTYQTAGIALGSYSSTLKTSNIVIQRVRVQGMNDWGLWFNGARDIFISDCVIRNNGVLQAGWGAGGIEIDANSAQGGYNSGVRISRCTVENNYGHGVSFERNSETISQFGNVVESSIIRRNGGYGVYASLLNSSVIANNLITNNTDANIGLYSTYALYNKVVGNTLTRSNASGLWCSACQFNIISQNTVAFNGDDGLQIDGSAQNNQIFENDIHDNSQVLASRWGISLGDATFTSVKLNRIWRDNGVRETGSAHSNRIENNDLRNGYTEISIVATNTTVTGNAGFVTENWGSTTSVSNGTWVSHGLDGTPTTIILTSRSNVTVYILGTNSTKIRVGVSSGTVTVDWFVKYKP